MGDTLMFVLVVVFITTVGASRWEANLGWCHAPAQLFEGDFNGDGKTDILCHRPSDGYKWIAYANANGQFTGTGWQRAMGWCYHTGASLHIGDFNGDGRSDLLCHDDTGYKWVALASSAGNFNSGNSWAHPLGWCWHTGAELHIGDFNGDGRDDMLCHDKNSGYKWIAFATTSGFFTGTNWERPLGWCKHNGAQLFIGDFNGDSKSDMLCHDGTGYKWIAYANSASNFNDGTGWENALGWCWHPGSSLHIGDFNGDGKDDMMCHDGNGYKWAALANCQNNFSGGTSWEADLGWCYHADGVFYLGDFNGDSKDDMLCHDKGNGYKWIIYATLFD